MMHFTLLTAVELPENYQNEFTAEIRRDMEEALEVVEEKLKKETDAINHSWDWHLLRGLRSPFGWAVQNAMNRVLDRYYAYTKNEAYIGFWNAEEDLYRAYQTERLDCFRLPDGTIVTVNDKRSHPFVIRAGKVYQRCAGQLQHEMRTKKARRMQALPNYSMKKLYPSFKAYVTEHRRIARDEKTGKYGYWFNPNIVFDMADIGGRWPFVFLVKDKCEEYSLGHRNCGIIDEPAAPEGYRWVAAARKKDIEWEVMFQIMNDNLRRWYDTLMRYLNGGKPPVGCDYTTDGIAVRQDGIEIIHKGDSFRKFRREYGITTRRKYFVNAASLIDSNGYAERKEACCTNKVKEIYTDHWYMRLDDYIDSLPKDAVLMRLDCHI